MLKGKCEHCGKETNLARDHIIPKSHGGSHKVGNLQILCSSCNTKKLNNNDVGRDVGDMTRAAFREIGSIFGKK